MLFLDLSNLEIISSCSKFKKALLTPVFSSLYNFLNYKTLLLPLLLNSVTLNNINNYFLLIKFSFCVCINIPFHTFFLPVFLRYNWQHYISLRFIPWWFDLHHEMFITISLGNINQLHVDTKLKNFYSLWWELLGFTLLTAFIYNIQYVNYIYYVVH